MAHFAVMQNSVHSHGFLSASKAVTLDLQAV